MRTSGANTSSSSARWIPTAASIAAFGFPKDAKKPSPVCLITSPPLSVMPFATSSSCRARSFFHLSSPNVSSSLVESTMSVKRNVRRASPAEKLVHALLVELRAELLELPARPGTRPWRRPRPAGVERDSQQHPRLRGLIGRAHVLPLVSRLSERPAAASDRPRTGRSDLAPGARWHRRPAPAGCRSCTRRR